MHYGTLHTEFQVGTYLTHRASNLSSRNRPGETVRLTPCSLVDVLALLNLICLICSTGSTICLTASVVSLLSTVINVIESGTLPFACSLYAADLRAAMLSCLASFETLHRSSGGASDSSSYRILHRLWDDNSAFALALEANVWSHLPLSCKFLTPETRPVQVLKFLIENCLSPSVVWY